MLDLPQIPGATADPDYYMRLSRTETVPEVLTPEGKRPETRDERDARRLAERMPGGYVPESAADMTFDPRMAYELALGMSSAAEVVAKYGLSEDRARALLGNPAFIATIKKYQAEIQDGGVGFRLKARIQAEDLLTHSYIIATDPETPASVRADIIKWTARVADLEPRDKKDVGLGAGGFQLNITFAGDRPGATLTGEVVDV
jgi:hypothetical protein